MMLDKHGKVVGLGDIVIVKNKFMGIVGEIIKRYGFDSLTNRRNTGVVLFHDLSIQQFDGKFIKFEVLNYDEIEVLPFDISIAKQRFLLMKLENATFDDV